NLGPNYYPLVASGCYISGRMKKYGLGCLGVVALLLLFTVIGGCGGYNRLVKLQQGVDAQWGQVQSQYQRRADLVPNLVQTVSGAANFEKSTLLDVTKARASVNQVQVNSPQAPNNEAQLRQFEQAQNELGSALSRLLVVVERYPDLKANANFRDLQAQLEGTENRIAVERMRFNEAVQSYNTAVNSLPTKLWAGIAGFHPKPYFQSTAGSETAPKVNFDFGKQTSAPAAPK
ncbi:MAG TPA: LemA family protein, partial [Verrucomicrobiae bacterium]|nr:LemA family protein [Verrucomicrobiae bacterium]